jgi:hypothetical protein
MDTQFLKNVGVYIVSAIISLLLIAYILYHLFGSIDSEIETLAAETVTGRETVTLDGYVMRSETVLFSSSQGDVNYLYADGAKVKKDAAVANVYASGGENVRAKIIELDRKLDLLESSNIGENITVSDTKVIDTQIAKLYSVIRERIRSGDLEYALRKKDELLILLNKRRIIVQNVASYDDKIQSLNIQRSGLTSQLTNITETVLAPISGYFYSWLDGYESVFNASKISKMTLEEFYAMTEAEPAAAYAGGYGIGKLVSDYLWYIACPVTVDRLRFFTPGAKYSVIFPYSSDTELQMTLTRIIEQTDDDRAVLVFSTGTIPENFNFLRKQTIEIVRSTYTGYRVPVSAVRIVDGKQGVYTLSGNFVRFKLIEPLFESKGYFIVSEYENVDEDKRAAALENGGAGYLALNDLIITKGKKLYDGRIVD